MKKITTVLSAVAAALALSATAFAAPSDWAVKSFETMNSIGAIPGDILSKDSAGNITRYDFAQLVVFAYNAYASEAYFPSDDHQFSDVPHTDAILSAVYDLGIMQGGDNNEFRPNDSITRQETAIVINNFHLALTNQSLDSGIDVIAAFDDIDEIAPWAIKAVSAVSNAGYMSHYGDDRFHPLDNVTIEQAVVMTDRLNPNPPKETPAPVLSGELAAKCAQADNHILVSWNAITNAKEYSVTVTEKRDHRRSGDIAPGVNTYTTASTQMQIPSAPGRIYEITVKTGNISEDIHFATQHTYNDTSGFELPETQEEAEPIMREIEINVWKVNGKGEKYASTAQLTVHKDVADTVSEIFQEIFEGDEQFPIASVGGYAWRGGRSEHNWGTAIDINPTQNYCIYTSGTIVGDFWKPYEDQYSITPYGDVMNAFENHGWTWGGDAWSGNVDYMHFSYFGT